MSGVLNLVSVGPGTSDLIVPRARDALVNSDVIVGYELYLRWIAPWIEGKEIHKPPLTQEKERALLALEKARAGAKVALISSGDIGIYAMAALAFEEMREDDTFAVNVVPGITAANACASLLGSPLSHDFATLSLSNLMCPWEWIEQRARHIAAADLACVLYNVQSNARVEGVYRILEIMFEHKSPQTLCGVIRNAYRPDQSVSVHRLADLPALRFDMLTTIVIGNRFTRRKREWIFTPRGYNDWAPGAGERGSNRTGADGAASSAGVGAIGTGVNGALSSAKVDGAALGTWANGAVNCAGLEGAAMGTGVNGAVNSAGVDGTATSTAVIGVASGAQTAGPSLPRAAVWVFSGTSDGNALVRELADKYGPVVVSTASEYGGELAREDCPGVTVWAGRQGVESRRRALHDSAATVIVDATHPYAQQMSEQLIRLSEELSIPYVRYERPSTLDEGSAMLCDTVEEAARRAVESGRRIFLATGSKDLATFLRTPGAEACEWFVRMTPEPAMIRRALDLGVSRDHILAMQGPFSEELNVALWRDQKIDCVVTKDSGEAGGFTAKVRAVVTLGIELVVIRRPRIAYPRVAGDFAQVGEYLRELDLQWRRKRTVS